MAARTARSKATAPLEARLVDAALALAAQHPWRTIGLPAIAQAAGADLAELYPAYSSKAAILDAFARRIDRQVLAGTGADLAEEPARDRLFDVLMRRFEALVPHRAALRSILAAQRHDPAGSVARLPAFLASMRWMVGAAGLDGTGWRGALRLGGATAAFLAVLPRFLEDGDDLARTMAALDRHLAQGEKFLHRIGRRRVTRADGHGIVEDGPGETAS